MAKEERICSKLVALILEVETHDDLNHVCGEIDRAYQSDKISAKDNDLLYKMVSKISALNNF